MEHVKKAFVDASQGLNALGAAAGSIIVTGSKTSFSLPSPAEASGQTITYLHTGTAQVKIQGKASGYSSWTLETSGGSWSFYSDGTLWYAIGGPSTGSNSNGSWIKFANGTMEQYGSTTTDSSGNSGTKSFPVPFVGSIATISFVSAEYYDYYGYSRHTYTLPSNATYTINNASTSGGFGNGVSWRAIGRWK